MRNQMKRRNLKYLKNNNNSDVNIISDSNSDLSDDDLENNEEIFFDKDVNEQVKALPTTPIDSKLIWAMKKIQALYNDDANKIIKEGTHVKTTKNLNFLVDLAMITTESVSVPGEPTSFNEAWNHPDITHREKWWEAICKEFADMNKQQVWRKTTKSVMPANQRCVKNKWVFKIKQNGAYWACLVASGYSQVPGIDFSENYSLVVNDITFCIMLLMVLHFRYSA